MEQTKNSINTPILEIGNWRNQKQQKRKIKKEKHPK